MPPWKLLLVDDHAFFRRTLRLLLAEDPRLHVVGEAGSYAEALALLQREQPDLILLDLNLPDGDGADLLDELLRRQSPCPILVITGERTTARVRAVLAAGAQGYLHKDALTEGGLLQAIHAIMEDLVVLDRIAQAAFFSSGKSAL